MTPRLLLITRDEPDLIARATAAARAGGPRVAVLLRRPRATAVNAQRLADALAPHGTPLLVHSADAVAASHAGLHLRDGARTPPGWPRDGKLIGRSCHDAAGLARAADYAVLSPVKAVPGKRRPLGWRRFEALAAACKHPVYALGGLEPIDAASARAAGAAGIAGIRWWLKAPSTEDAVRRALDAWGD